MKNVDEIENCYGCGVCSIICPVDIVKIELNSEGFYEPVIYEHEKCIDCQLCLNVCAFYNEGVTMPNDKLEINKSYATWSNNTDVRQVSSSGGTGFEIGKKLIEKGYIGCGVKYEPSEYRAKHFLTTSVHEYRLSMGSKYIQSYTVEAFSQIEKGKKYLITGAPCQIDSIRRYIKKKRIEDNFILLDFFCHGVPSMLLWDKYINENENEIGKIKNASWREKTTGWHDSWVVRLVGEHTTKKSWHTRGDLFYKMFLEDRCLGKACYENCKYKLESSAADIRIGDLWGQKYRDNESGVTGLIAFSETGINLVKELSEKECTIIEHPMDVVLDGQMAIPPQLKRSRGKVLSALKTTAPLKDIYIYKVFIPNFVPIVLNKIKWKLIKIWRRKIRK